MDSQLRPIRVCPHSSAHLLWARTWNPASSQAASGPPRQGLAAAWSGIGILASPVYYHEYMLGDLFAAQVRHDIMREVFPLKDVDETSFRNHPEVGVDLREKIFGPGNLHPWNELMHRATGEPPTARYFAANLAE